MSSAIERATPPVGRRAALQARAAIAAAVGDSAGTAALLIEAYPPTGRRSDLYHTSPQIYELLRAYAPLAAIVRPAP